MSVPLLPLRPGDEIRLNEDQLETLRLEYYLKMKKLNSETLVILLCGGDKSTQDRDIAKAIKYWEQYNGGQK